MENTLRRIAEIKIKNSKKLYDYFCDDKTINENDLVYVEGLVFPVFVSAIKEKKETLANKNVLSVANVNNNVKFNARYNDISKYKADAIIDIIGIEDKLNNVNELLSDKLSKAQFNTLLSFISNAKPFDLFVNINVNLHYKNIIHIIVPKRDKDFFGNNLKEAYCKAIDKAIELGSKTIVLPQVNNEVSGYSKHIIDDSITDAINKYRCTPNIKIELITLINKLDIKKEIIRETKKEIVDKALTKSTKTEDTTNIFESLKNKPLDINAFDMQKLKFDRVYFDALIQSKYNSTEEYDYSPSDKEVKYPFFFAHQYAKDNNMYDPIADKYSSDMCKKFRTGKKEFKKYDVFKLAILEKMNYTVFLQFLRCAGFSISPLTLHDVDLTVFKYIYKYNGFVNGKDHFLQNIVKMTEYGNYLLDEVWNY